MELSIKTFLDRRCDLRFNVLTEVTEFRFKGCGEFLPVDTRARNALCAEAHLEGVDCWDRDLLRVVESFHVADHHPFRAYFEGLPEWDGRDRLTDLGARVSADAQWQRHFHRWMLGVAAQWAGLGDGLHAQSVAPLLVSDEQGMGKSTFCRALMPPELSAYYTDNVNLTQPASVERLLVETGLINLDEFDRIPSGRQPQLKNLMQLCSLNMRRAYKSHASRLPRVASFIGTSNSRELLSDPTGSRRFICVSVERPIPSEGIDHAQVYAQLKAELQAGARYWFSKAEEAELQRTNLAFYRTTPVEEVFRHCLRAPRPGETGLLLSLPQVYELLRRRCPGLSAELKLNALARTLVACGVRRVHTERGNRYRLVEV
ncbi:MAG: DUF3874 domain-containing protein [Clostridium sp.]|nr:DUF3874 domain-containing protein [Clostridium sp.]